MSVRPGNGRFDNAASCCFSSWFMGRAIQVCSCHEAGTKRVRLARLNQAGPVLKLLSWTAG